MARAHDQSSAGLIDQWVLDRLAEARTAGVALAAEAERAAHAANEGRVEEAEAVLRAVLEASENLVILFLGFQFYFRTGHLNEAERVTVRRLGLAEGGGESEDTARAWTNLGLIHLASGRYESARSCCERGVAIDERLGNDEGVARDLGNLANVFEAVGDLDRAEALNRRSLAIARRIGAGEIGAGRLANLGDIAHSRGKMDEAMALWSGALEEFDRLGIEKWRNGLLTKLADATGAVRRI